MRYLFQRSPKHLIRILVEGIQVVPHGAREQHRLLGDDGQLAAELVQAQLRRLATVDYDLAF